MNSFRRAIAHERQTRGPKVFLVAQFLATAIGLGIWLQSWPVFIGVFFGLCALCGIATTAVIITFVYAGFWSALLTAGAYQAWGLPGGMIVALLGTLMSFGLHFNGMVGLIDSASPH